MKNVLYVLLGVFVGFLLGGVMLFVSRKPAGEPIVLRAAPTSAPIKVHVVGAVPRPDVYELLEGARVQDALDAAGARDRRWPCVLHRGQPAVPADHLRDAGRPARGQRQPDPEGAQHAGAAAGVGGGRQLASGPRGITKAARQPCAAVAPVPRG